MKAATQERPRAWRQRLAAVGLGLVLVTPLALGRQPVAAATFMVTHTGNSGAGSLRQAILAANAAPGSDTIRFQVPISDPGFAGGVFTIRPASELPAITGPTFLDGFSQTAFTGNTNPNGPEVVLNGFLAGAANGLLITGPNSVIRGLVINDFVRDGIQFVDEDATGNRVEGSYIGVNAAGTAAVPNGDSGVHAHMRAMNNRIGGTSAAARNVISGNVGAGVNIEHLANATVILGNYIGTNAAGTAVVPNSTGVSVLVANNNRIGGTEAGSRNLISGNGFGVGLEEGHDNFVQGNYIGTDVSGSHALPNTVGVIVSQGDVLIGGASSARNVISGNIRDGVHMTRGAEGSRVQGNYIGLNAAGTLALPNQRNGVAVFDAVDNLVGGTEASARNIISGNGQHGVLVGFDAAENQVQGNYIGTNPVGRVSIPNGGHGVRIEDGAVRIEVGGAAAGARNLISGNRLDGVRISGTNVSFPSEPPTSFNVVQGNFIGTDVNGSHALPNGGNGVSLVEGTTNITIGGTITGARNLISGNTGHGLQLDAGGTQQNVVAGNYIGTNLAGTVALPNGGNGVYLTVNTHDNRIGGTTVAARNLISGNREGGVELDGAGARNRVEGNYIGVNVHGSGALPNLFGVFVFAMFVETFIGGSDPGARNVISGNQGAGIAIEEASQVRVLGNLVGSNALGSAAVPNGGSGIIIGNAGNHQIGGSTVSERNLFSGNRRDGVNIQRGSSLIQVLGNYIGVNLAGTGALPNERYGVVLFEAGPNTIGGTAVGSRNVISANRRGGVWLAEAAEQNELLGNFIGVNAAGTLALPNNGHGVEIANSSRNCIGGAAAGAGNVISGNQLNGIFIEAFEPSPSEGNEILGNRIGTNAAGTKALPNRGNGVELTREDVHGNRIGGAAAGEGNQIAFNEREGVLLRAVLAGDNTLVGNPIRANSIHDNRRLGINLQPAGESPSRVTPNDFQDPDPGPNRLQNFPKLTDAAIELGVRSTIIGALNSTPNSSFALDFFRSPARDLSGFGEGQQYLGSLNVTTDGSGNASFTFVATGAGEAGFFTATATNRNTLDTSEFSVALQNSPSKLAASDFSPSAQFVAGRSPVAGRITGQIASAAGAGVGGVRVSLHQPLPGSEVYSRDWDPQRLQVTQTEADGSFRFGGLAPGRYLALAYAPGLYFTPRAQELVVGVSAAPEALFTVAGVDAERPAITVAPPVAGSSDGLVIQGGAADGGSGVRAVLVRLQAGDAEPALPPRWLDWRTGSWSSRPDAAQTRWAVLDARGSHWQLELPHLAAGQYRLEVEAYDWAGHASRTVTASFQVR